MKRPTQFKTNIIERYQRGESLYQVAEDEGCDYSTVLRRLKRRGINTSQRYWTNEEKEKLKELYPITSTKELLREFPDRAREAIRAVASKLMAKKEKYKQTCEICKKKFVMTHRSNRTRKTICSLCAIKKWAREHPKNLKKSRKKWNKKNPEYKKEYAKKYMKDWMRNYLKYRRKNDHKFRLDQNMGHLIYHSLRNKKAGRKWECLVNYTLEELIEHLESRFNNKMNWDNYGNYWHVDHVRPRSLFKYTVPEDREFKECWSLKNLQPLEKTANLKKSDTFTL